jgi:siroheme decarboxylase
MTQILNLSDVEKRVLNRVQKDWLITEDPFKNLSDELGINEDRLIQVMGVLKQKNIIRDISAIFNASGLGYESALIAFEVSDKEIGNAASIINAHPGVSHNYLRDHRYNIWFTLAVNRKTSLQREAEILAEKLKVKDFLILNNERLFKIGVMFDIGESDDAEETINNADNKLNHHFRKLSLEEKKAVYILQMDLPLVKSPFKRLLEKVNPDIDEKNVVQIGESLKKDGIIRRYSAIVKHTEAGYKANAMTAWKLKDYNDSKIIQLFSSVKNISHLYLRTLYPGKWDHGLFAMIHARNEDELTEIIKRLEKQTGIKDYLILHSLKEFKKKRIKYFTDEF